MREKNYTAIAYVVTFMVALLTFVIFGLLQESRPATGGEWLSFIAWGFLISVVASAIIGTLVAFRGRLGMKRSQNRREEKT